MKKLLTPLFYTFITLSVFACGKSAANDAAKEQAKKSINQAIFLSYRTNAQPASVKPTPDGLTTTVNFVGKTGTASLIEYGTGLTTFTASNYSHDGIHTIDAQLTVKQVRLTDEANPKHPSFINTDTLNGSLTLKNNETQLLVFKDLEIKISGELPQQEMSLTIPVVTLTGSVTIDGTTYTYANDNFDLTETP